MQKKLKKVFIITTCNRHDNNIDGPLGISL